MFYSIKFFIRDTYYTIINRLWRRLYRTEHHRFVEEYLKEHTLKGGGEYWKAIIEYYETFVEEEN